MVDSEQNPTLKLQISEGFTSLEDRSDCDGCKFDIRTCPNRDVKLALVPMEEGDHPARELGEYPNWSYFRPVNEAPRPTGLKQINVVREGRLDLLPTMVAMCRYFRPKLSPIPDHGNVVLDNRPKIVIIDSRGNQI